MCKNNQTQIQMGLQDGIAMGQLCKKVCNLRQDIVEVSAPVNLKEEGKGIIETMVPVVNMLSLVQYLVDSHGVDLKSEDLRQYWNHVKEYYPWGNGHAGCESQDFYFWPLSLYGDEARYTDSAGFIEKIVVVNMSFVLWRPASTRNSRFILFACRESLCVEHKTLWAVYRYIRWALDVLFEGLKPESGYLGQSLPQNLRRSTPNSLDPLCRNGTRFALTEVRGDWAWHVFSLQLIPRWNSAKCCFKCRADSCERLDYTLTASWISNQYSHPDFLRLC